MLLRRHLSPDCGRDLGWTPMLRSDRHAETLLRPSTTVVVDRVPATRGIRNTPDTARQPRILLGVAERVPRRMVACPGPHGFHRLRRNS
eukprot:4506877-Alexandrium_andersonii.AAC.1